MEYKALIKLNYANDGEFAGDFSLDFSLCFDVAVYMSSGGVCRIHGV